MDVRWSALAAVFLTVLTAPDVVAAASACKLGALAELPVTMRRSQPMIPAKINGTDVRFLVDSGATAAGQTDIAAARAVNARIVGNAAARGFVP